MSKSVLDITIDDKGTLKMVNELLNRIQNPAPLLKVAANYTQSETRKMFRGKRPDTIGVRGEHWPKLAASTLKAKKAAVARGDAIEAARPLVRTGKLRNSLESKSAIQLSKKGFQYGTNVKSNRGFPYPGVHQVGDPPVPQRRWLFLTKENLMQIAIWCKEYLQGQLSKLKGV